MNFYKKWDNSVEMKNVHSKQLYYLVIAGMFCLTIAMGIGRFAYTPLLPLMQEAEQFSSILAGNLASVNYIGYFVGALVAGMFLKRSTNRLFLFLLLNLATTLFMGATANTVIWMALRFFSGLTSGLVFVFASSIVIDEISKVGKSSLSGILYGGVGLGIFLSGLLVSLLPNASFWEIGWYVLGGLCISLFIFIVLGFRGISGEIVAVKQAIPTESVQKMSLKRLYFSYGCEGFGYIICATFLISMITSFEFFTWHPALVWAAVGLAAIPSCMIWAKLGSSFGNIIALRGAYVLQMIGIILPILVKHDVAAVIGAILFGATFMGITTLTITIGKELSVGSSTKVISGLTAIYGIGQILGPALSGLLAFFLDGYEGAMMVSAVVLFVALLSIQSINIKEEEQCRM